MASNVPHAGKTRIAFACGGSGGDVYPALAVAEALPQGFEAIILGSTAGLEARLSEQHGFRLVATRASPLAGTSALGKARSLLATTAGAASARRVLRREAAQAVVGFGGYASAPAVIAAWSLGIPVLLFEANAVVGTANRLLERFAARMLLGTQAAQRFCRRPAIVTGVPVRADVMRVRAAPPGKGLRLLVCGGSFGSRFLDKAAADLAARLVAAGVPVGVHHIGDPQRATAAYRRAGITARIVAFETDMAGAYEAANLAVVSGGATTLAELAAVGLPALVVPLATAARDHQAENAREFATATGAMWCREQDWNAPELAAAIVDLVRVPGAWHAAADRVRRRHRPEAAAAIVKACLDATDSEAPRKSAVEAT